MWQDKSEVKARGSNSVRHLILSSLNVVEVKGIPGVAVQCVDIRRNIGSESALLGHY